MKHVDVIILGSGISALTAGLILAKNNKSVLLLEQHTKIGGYLHCFRRFGERFDTGAHYAGSLGQGEAFQNLLKYLEIWDPEDYSPLDHEGFDEFITPHFHFSVPKGYAAFEKKLIAQFPHEKDGIQLLLQKVQSAVQYFSTYQLSEFSPQNFPPEIFDRSLASVVETLIKDTDLQQLFYIYCALHGASPREVSFGFHSVIIDTLLTGAYGFRHGGDLLAQRYQKEIEKYGGEILTKHKVIRLETREKNITTVHTSNGEVFTSTWVISSLHPRNTFDLVDRPEVLTPLFRSRIQNLQEGPSFFGIYALLKNDGSFRHDKNYFFINSTQPDMFPQLPDVNDPQLIIFMSPARRTPQPDAEFFPVNIHALAPYEWFAPWAESTYGRRPEEYKSFKKDIADKVLASIESRHPGFCDKIFKFETSSPLSHLHFNGSHQGSAYGVNHSMSQSGPRAIGPRTKILNLLLTGQNSLFPGLLGSAISGMRTAGHIVGLKQLVSQMAQQTDHPSQIETVVVNQGGIS